MRNRAKDRPDFCKHLPIIIVWHFARSYVFADSNAEVLTFGRINRPPHLAAPASSSFLSA